ncbi:MAG: hypothetical protein MUF21_01380 [Gemmatimonadaceae bacterium]|nr:hypothetical protein [Gemmatimonadaceae bacterium]
MTRSRSTTSFALAALALVACNGPRRIHERPILVNGDRVPSADRIVQQANAAGTREQQQLVRARDSVYARAVGSCQGEICAYITKGEIAIGMTPAQVMAATRTSPQAWTWRESGDAGVLVPRAADIAPRDANGEVVMVQFRDERAASMSFRETQGIRVVSSALDTVGEERMLAAAEALIREGDQFLAAGDRVRALDRFDRASALKPEDPHLQYRIATLLDLQFNRPMEAMVRYQRFLTSQEIQLIQARGTANAQLADAIARAQQRLIVIERAGGVAQQPAPAPAATPAPAPPPPTSAPAATPMTVEVKVTPTQPTAPATPAAPAPPAPRPDTIPPLH